MLDIISFRAHILIEPFSKFFPSPQYFPEVDI